MTREIFVFGSNEAGIHGAGSARAALEHHGAKLGVGIGAYGDSYAIPTKDRFLDILSLNIIERYVLYFIQWAKDHPEMKFNIVDIGCGLAGFKISDIAPMFKDAPENCFFLGEFGKFLGR